MKTQKQKRDEEQAKIYRKVIATVNIDKAVKAFGEKAVKWAIGKYLVRIRDRARLLKEKADAEQKLAEIARKL